MKIDELKTLRNMLEKQSPSSPLWFQVIDHVVTALLAIEIARAETPSPVGEG